MKAFLTRGNFVAYLLALIVAFTFTHHQPVEATFFGSGIPAGAMMPWWSTDTAPPTGWHLCDGSTQTWLTGPHAGSSVTLPNTIGMFFVGSDLQSGANTANGSGFGHITNQSVGGATAHSHTVAFYNQDQGGYSGGGWTIDNGHTTTSASNQPASIGCPMIIKL